MKNFKDLNMERCEDPHCCRNMYHCQLCPPKLYRPTYKQQLIVHYISHWKTRVPYKSKLQDTRQVNQHLLLVAVNLQMMQYCNEHVNLSAYFSHLIRLWYLSSSVNSFFKHTCTAIQLGYMSNFWLDLLSTSILHMCKQQRLWRDCRDVQAHLSLRWLPM